MYVFMKLQQYRGAVPSFSGEREAPEGGEEVQNHTAPGLPLGSRGE